MSARDVTLLELELFTADDCAALFRCSRAHFLDCFAKVPGFPEPFRFRINNRGTPGTSQIRWDAGQVRAWHRANRIPAHDTPPYVPHDTASP